MKSGYRPLEISRRGGGGSSSFADSTGGGKSNNAKGIIQLLIDYWAISWMFVFLPLAIAAKLLHWGDCVIFWLNFLAIIPLAWIMGQATEDCAASLGTIAGGLLNAWFGNIVEMLLCIAGLRTGELVVVRCTLIGSVLSNLLLVAGCSLLAGGLCFKVQEFSAPGASTTTSLLFLGAFCATMPTMYDVVAKHGFEQSLKISRITALLMVSIYAQFMVFQLRTHSFFYEGHTADPVSKSEESGLKRGRFGSKISVEEEDEIYLSPIMAAVVLGTGTLICSFCSEFLIGSIEGTVADLKLSKEFVGIILLPIIGNAAEHYTSVVVAIHNSMDLSLGCAVGSSCQMLLFVTPMTILAGWIFGQPLSLDVHAFEAVILLLAILSVTMILQDGYSNWLEGSILCTAYVVIAIAYFCEDPKLSEII